MTVDQQQHDELRDLLWSLEEGSISAEGIGRIDELVCDDTDLLRLYIEHLRLFSDLRFGATNRHVAETLDRVFGNEERGLDTSVPSGTDVAFPFHDLSIHHSAFTIQQSYFGGVLFSYVAALLILGTALAIAWVWKLPDYRQIAQRQTPPTVERQPRHEAKPQMKFVGRITGMVDCEWSDPNTAVPGPVAVPLGRKYALSAGLMEITYDTGARVILQGPCTYQVESAAGGYLEVGKLTARVEGKAEGGGRKADEATVGREDRQKDSNRDQSQRALTLTLSQRERGPDSPSPFRLPPSALFFVRTPTATITDLGTEFGVTVEPSGATETHVFQGKVEARLAGADSDAAGTFQLEANQSARVEIEVGRKPVIRLTAGDPETFVRKLTKPVPIQLFSTGVGLNPGDPDPHWQLVAQSNDANFQPRPAIVVPTCPAWLANEVEQSQWISALADFSAVPDGVTYTFRTTFELTDVRPETARLTGWFIVDNHVRAIRLNGHEAAVPKHEQDHSTFDLFHKFSIDKGFVDGTNVLEIEVENGKSFPETENSLMGLRVRLEASVQGK